MDPRTPQDQQTNPETGAPGARTGVTPAPSARTKAPTDKRILAALIDAGLTLVVGFVPIIGWLVGAAYWLLRDGFEFDFMKHRSLGKHFMGIHPVTLDGAPMDLVASAKRNWTLAIGGIASFLLIIPFIGWLIALPVALIGFGMAVVELVMALTDAEGRRIGDRTGNTQVVLD